MKSKFITSSMLFRTKRKSPAIEVYAMVRAGMIRRKRWSAARSQKYHCPPGMPGGGLCWAA